MIIRDNTVPIEDLNALPFKQTMKIAELLTEGKIQQCEVFKNKTGEYEVEDINGLFYNKEYWEEKGYNSIGIITGNKRISGIKSENIINQWRFDCDARVFEIKLEIEGNFLGDIVFEIYSNDEFIKNIICQEISHKRDEIIKHLNDGRCPMCNDYSEILREF